MSSGHDSGHGQSISADNSALEEDEFDNPFQVYKRLIEVLSNELQSPELLPYESLVVEYMVDQIQHMGDNIKQFANRLSSFCIEQHKMELERFNFVINKYLRTRLEKIERNASTLIKIIKSDHERAKRLMSMGEMKYLDNYVISINDHTRNALSGLPPAHQSFNLCDIKSNDRSQFDCHYVFVKALQNTSVLVEDSFSDTTFENRELEKDSYYFLPYSAVRRHLQSSSKDLVLL